MAAKDHFIEVDGALIAYGAIGLIRSDGDGCNLYMLGGGQIATPKSAGDVLALMDEAIKNLAAEAAAESLALNDVLLEKARIQNTEIVDHGIDRQVEIHDQHYHGKPTPPIAKA